MIALEVIRGLRADPKTRSNWRFVVVDQNQLRCESLESHIADPNTVVVLPDAAIMEMAKSPQWEWMIRNALKRLSRMPTRVAMAIGNGELLSLERQHQEPLALGELLDIENTIVIEGLLRETAHGQRGPYYGWIERLRPGRLRAMAEGHLNHAKNFDMLQELLPTILGAISLDHQKRFRRQEISAEERRRMVSGITSAIFFSVMKDGGISDTNAQRLFEAKSYLARYAWLRVWQVVRWIEKGGHTNVDPMRLTNDLIDLHYVLVGSYADELLTIDAGAREAYEDLRGALQGTFSWDIDVNYLSAPIEVRGEPHG